MKRTRPRNVFAVPANSKTVLNAIFLVVIICLLGRFIGTSHANGNRRIALLIAVLDTASTKHVEASDSEDPVQWQTVHMRVTAYCPCSKCCGSYSDGITASGHKISEGDRFVAADRRYPFGTEMIIPGYKNSQTVEVLDRGGAIRGNRLDVFFNSHQEALEWGVRYLDVKIRHQ
ncbi:MAG: 3D domain-containing protein [Planctomycetota bacterium]